jgi:putative transposase
MNRLKSSSWKSSAGDGYPYGYKKLTASMQEDYGLNINHKKVYRLCKELDVLLPQRKVNPKHPRKLAKRIEVTGSNQLWQMDLKYGYIAGMDRFFFMMSIIDVYDRCIVGYHIGLNALALSTTSRKELTMISSNIDCIEDLTSEYFVLVRPGR